MPTAHARKNAPTKPRRLSWPMLCGALLTTGLLLATLQGPSVHAGAPEQASDRVRGSESPAAQGAEAAPTPAAEPEPAEPEPAEPEPVLTRGSFGGSDSQGPEPVVGPTFVDPVAELGQRARGLYITLPYLRMKGARGILALLRGARMDTAVIDLKDDAGRVTHATSIEELKDQVYEGGADVRSVVSQLRSAGIYTVARVVAFRDPVLPDKDTSRAVMDSRRKRAGQAWVSWGTATTWLDPYNTRNHDLVLALAREAEELGFDEVQLDYIRFPVDAGTQFAVYPAQTDTERRFVLLDLLRRVDAALTVPLGVDVFGLTVLREGDPTGLGQSLRDWTEHVEVFSPMLYLNAMQGWRRDADRRGYRLIKNISRIFRRRLGGGPILRPFLQGFKNGVPDYGAGVVQDQVEGARHGRADGFMFWNPGSKYSAVSAGMRGAPRFGQPFPLRARGKLRAAIWARGEYELSPDKATRPRGW